MNINITKDKLESLSFDSINNELTIKFRGDSIIGLVLKVEPVKILEKYNKENDIEYDKDYKEAFW